jgi:hypothetical protein
MKLNPTDLSVESFETDNYDDEVLPTTNDPTPATYCRWCPEPTYTCP